MGRKVFRKKSTAKKARKRGQYLYKTKKGWKLGRRKRRRRKRKR